MDFTKDGLLAMAWPADAYSAIADEDILHYGIHYGGSAESGVLLPSHLTAKLLIILIIVIIIEIQYCY